MQFYFRNGAAGLKPVRNVRVVMQLVIQARGGADIGPSVELPPGYRPGSPDPVRPGKLPFQLGIIVKYIEMKEIAMSPLRRLWPP